MESTETEKLNKSLEVLPPGLRNQTTEFHIEWGVNFSTTSETFVNMTDNKTITLSNGQTEEFFTTFIVASIVCVVGVLSKHRCHYIFFGTEETEDSSLYCSFLFFHRELVGSHCQIPHVFHCFYEHWNKYLLLYVWYIFFHRFIVIFSRVNHCSNTLHLCE